MVEIHCPLQDEQLFPLLVCSVCCLVVRAALLKGMDDWDISNEFFSLETKVVSTGLSLCVGFR